MSDKETIARRAAQSTAPLYFQPILERDILFILSDLRANDYYRFKRENPNGDYEQFTANSHKTIDADASANVDISTQKNVKALKKYDEVAIANGKAVGEVCEATFLPTVNGEELDGWNKVKIQTDEGLIDFDTRSEIIDRPGDWYGTRAATRQAFLSKYVNYTYSKRILNKAGQRIGKVTIVLRVR